MGQAINYADLGAIFEHRGQLDSAWTYYRMSMQHNCEAGSTLGIALCHTYYGSLYEKSGQYDKAKTEYETAYRLMHASRDRWHALSSLVALAEIHYATGDDRQAKAYLDRAYTQARAIGSTEHLGVVSMMYYTGRMRRRSHSALKRMSSIREQFYTNVTHEFRTPLTVILGLSDELQKDAADEAEVRVKAHIFEPFYQGEGDPRHVGTGVGLSLVKQVMDAVDGEITVQSTLGQGTTFHLSIPIVNKGRLPVIVDADADRLPQRAQAVMPADSYSGEGAPRLLIVEDNNDIATYIGSHFAPAFSLSFAANGSDGLYKAVEQVPDLIITDLMMPGMDGLELCRRVRANDIINHLPIIIITAKPTDEDRVKGIRAGADAYLVKPFDGDELRASVEKLLDSRRLLREKYARHTDERPEDPLMGTTPYRDADMRFLGKVVDAVYQQLNRGREVSVPFVASTVSMSSSQLYRKLMALTGHTPAAYIQRVKIKLAMNLLDREPAVSFAAVAERCGFDTYPNFVRSFKNVCGITPTAYRKKSRQLDKS